MIGFVAVGTGLGETADGTVEHLAFSKVARDHAGIAGLGMGARQHPAAGIGVLDVFSGRHVFEIQLDLHVAQLAHIEIGVEPVDARKAREDVAVGLHQAQEFGSAIFVGSTNVITSKPVPDNLLALMEKYSVTSFFAPPTVWIALLRSPLLDPDKIASLAKGYYGASIMPVEVLRELAARLPRVRLWNLYGQTEAAPVATMLGPADQLRKAGSCGRAVLNVETRVVDDQMRDVQRGGEVGEIVHRSPHLMLGYFHDDERTRAAFEGDWFHSGDLATMDEEGYITVVDRNKDMIKTGGENVAGREVEEMIYRLPQVSEVAVIGLPDPRWVEAVTAVVVLKAGQSLAEADLIAHCNTHMAGFKAPKRVVFIDALPKNPSGKVLKRELRLSCTNIA